MRIIWTKVWKYFDWISRAIPGLVLSDYVQSNVEIVELNENKIDRNLSTKFLKKKLFI